MSCTIFGVNAIQMLHINMSKYTVAIACGAAVASAALTAVLLRHHQRLAASPPAVAPASTASPAAGSDYADKAVLVTGASSGIGAATAVAAAARGARFVGVAFSSNAAGADATAAACRAAAPGPIVVKTYGAALGKGDSSVAAATALVEAVLADAGTLDVAILNAGVYRECDVVDPSIDLAAFSDAFNSVIGTNLLATAQLCFLLARHWIGRCDAGVRSAPSPSSSTLGGGGGGAPHSPPAPIGALVLVGSRGAFRGEPKAWAYGASKAGLHSLAGSMSVALGRFGVVCTAVAPGFVATPMVAARLGSGPEGRAIASQSPWSRVAEPREVAEAALFAGAYWRCAWLSGAILDVNGASYLRH